MMTQSSISQVVGIPSGIFSHSYYATDHNGTKIGGLKLGLHNRGRKIGAVLWDQKWAKDWGHKNIKISDSLLGQYKLGYYLS